MLLKVTFALLAIIASAQTPLDHTRESFADAIDEVRASIVQVVELLSDFTMSRGTGFLVNEDGFVVTAAHVITPPTGKTIQRISILTSVPSTNIGGMSLRGNFAGSIAKLVAVDQRHDIAILQPLQNPFSSPYGQIQVGAKVLANPAGFAAFDLARQRDGDGIFIAGFPLSSSTLTTTSGRLASVEAYDSTPPALSDIYTADIQVNPGNSGGPVFSDKTHSVVGICVAYEGAPIKTTDTDSQAYGLRSTAPGQYTVAPIGQNSGLARVIPAKYVADLLTVNGVKFSTYLSRVPLGTASLDTIPAGPIERQTPKPPSTRKP